MARLTLYRQVFKSPIGTLHALASEDALVAVEFDRLSGELEKKITTHFGPHTKKDYLNPVLEEVRFYLACYFQGQTNILCKVRTDLRGTDFEKSVWKQLKKIPFGKVLSYGKMAELVGSPGGARGVGQSCHRNPISILVPCHRVVATNGKLTGYGGGLDRKKWLLKHEGVLSTTAPKITRNFSAQEKKYAVNL